MPAKPLTEEQLLDAARLRAVFEQRKHDDPSWSQEKLAHACGWKTQGTVNQYFNGRIPLNLLAIKKFAEVLNFSVEAVSPTLAREIAELATLRNPASMDGFLRQLGGLRVTTPDDADAHVYQIRLLEQVQLRAGITGFQADTVYDDAVAYSIDRRWADRYRYNPEDLIAVAVKGESMEPALYEGDIVVINTADRKPVDGQVFAINHHGEPIIKRVRKDRIRGVWMLTSDNADQKRFQPQVCRGDDCLFVGRIVRKDSSHI